MHRLQLPKIVRNKWLFQRKGFWQDKGSKEAALPLPPKPAQQKNITVKPKPEVVIVISSCETEQVKRENPNRKKANEASLSKKKGQTLTSTLIARSKAVCGLNNKPNEHMSDNDGADATNELAAVEYVEDMYKFYKEAEVHFVFIIIVKFLFFCAILMYCLYELV